MSAIEAFTRGQVTRQEMLPDGWRQQWPELCGDKLEDIWPELAAPSVKHDISAAEPVELSLVDRRIGPVDRRVAQLPFDGLDRRIGPADRRGLKLVDIAQTGQGV